MTGQTEMTLVRRMIAWQPVAAVLSLFRSNVAWALAHIPLVPAIVLWAPRGFGIEWLGLGFVAKNVVIAAAVAATHRSPN